MLKKKKRVEAPNKGEADKKRKLNEISNGAEDQEMVTLAKGKEGNESNSKGEEKEEEEEEVFECLNCSA